MGNGVVDKMSFATTNKKINSITGDCFDSDVAVLAPTTSFIFPLVARQPLPVSLCLSTLSGYLSTAAAAAPLPFLFFFPPSPRFVTLHSHLSKMIGCGLEGEGSGLINHGSL